MDFSTSFWKHFEKESHEKASSHFSEICESA